MIKDVKMIHYKDILMVKRNNKLLIKATTKFAHKMKWFWLKKLLKRPRMIWISNFHRKVKNKLIILNLDLNKLK